MPLDLDDPLVQMLSARLDRQDLRLDAILAQARLTNGRVTDLEVGHRVAEGVRKARAEEVEERRKTLAADLAKYTAYRAWWRPTLAGSLGGLALWAVPHFLL